MDIGWEHPLDASEGWEGLNDGDMEHFVKDPIVKTAREGIQNSLDAKNPKNNEPVIVTFRLLDVNVSDVPNFEELRSNIKSALESQNYHKKNDEGSTADKTIKTYEEALNLLDGETISIFQIEDSNSTGMYWDEGKESPFFNYIKARSYSQKPEDALGAFGIGKLAPFVVSDLRTVFASSVYQIGSTIHQSTQGKSKLSSLFDDNTNSKTQRIAIGFWGDKNGYNPIFDLDSSKFSWIQKSNSDKPKAEDIGTVISTLGFNGNNDGIWNYWIVEAVLMNFFQAILDRKLEVIVEGISPKDNYKINNKSLDMFFDIESKFAQKIKKERDENGQNWERNFLCTHQYLELLKDDQDEVTIYPLRLTTLGYCELRVKVSDGLLKRICYIREGMKISETIDAPGVRNFSDLMDFVAIFECMEPKGNKILRAMENPAHNSWDPERPQNLNDKRIARKALNEIGNSIREILNKSAKNEAKKVKDIDLMIKYGFVFEGDDQETGINREIHPFKAPVNIEMIEVKTPKPPSKKPGTQGNNKGQEKGKGTKNNNKSRSGNDGRSSLDPQVSNFRSVRGKSSKSISVFFTPEFSGDAYLYLYKSQADGRSEEHLPINKWNDEPISKNTLSQNYTKGERCYIDLELKESFEGSLEIVLLAKEGE
jgi:hypothetical protein